MLVKKTGVLKIYTAYRYRIFEMRISTVAFVLVLLVGSAELNKLEA